MRAFVFPTRPGPWLQRIQRSANWVAPDHTRTFNHATLSLSPGNWSRKWRRYINAFFARRAFSFYDASQEVFPSVKCLLEGHWKKRNKKESKEGTTVTATSPNTRLTHAVHLRLFSRDNEAERGGGGGGGHPSLALSSALRSSRPLPRGLFDSPFFRIFSVFIFRFYLFLCFSSSCSTSTSACFSCPFASLRFSLFPCFLLSLLCLFRVMFNLSSSRSGRVRRVRSPLLFCFLIYPSVWP